MRIAGSSTRPQPRTTTSTTRTDRANGRKRLKPTSRQAWRAWLQKHHATSSGVWVLFAKQHTGLDTPSYDAAVEEALCFGWIDGQTYPVDDTYYMRLFTPRRPKSVWAKSNKTRVARLLEQGLMTEAGLAAVDAAKRHGTWNALDHVEAMTIPPDLRQALRGSAAAKKGWTAFTMSQRKQFLYRLASAKRAATREARLARIVSMCERGVTPAREYDARRRQRTG